MIKLEHITMEAQGQEELKKTHSALSIQNLRDNLEERELKPEQEIVSDRVDRQLADKNYSPEKPDLATQKLNLAQQRDKAKAKFAENQAKFAENWAKFSNYVSEYLRLRYLIKH
jgi:hypothetical protein